MDDEDAIRDLKREVEAHDRTAERLEEDARNRRRMAECARKAAEYIIKQRGT